MRTEKEVKDKLLDLLGVELEQRSSFLKLVDQLDKQALHTLLVEHHFQRGMDHFVEPSVAAHNR